jgi:hypothetical protein
MVITPFAHAAGETRLPAEWLARGVLFIGAASGAPDEIDVRGSTSERNGERDDV